jgi:hypothetical protein
MSSLTHLRHYTMELPTLHRSEAWSLIWSA